jgi:hypothetical protein
MLLRDIGKRKVKEGEDSFNAPRRANSLGNLQGACCRVRIVKLLIFNVVAGYG